MNFKYFTLLSLIFISLKVAGQNTKDEVSAIVVEVLPSYPTGMGDFYSFVAQNMKYPEEVKGGIPLIVRRSSLPL